MLKWLTKKTYATLSEVLGAVHKELEELQPVDTDSIKWTKGKEGMRAELNRELLGGGGLAEEQEEGQQPIYVKVKLLNYPGEVAVPKFTGVVITGVESLVGGMWYTSNNPVLLSDYTEIPTAMADDNPTFVVLQNELSNGSVGDAIISGMTVALVAVRAGQTNYKFCSILPDGSGLGASLNGPGKHIYGSRQDHSTNSRYWLVNLSTEYVEQYNGMFKVGYIDDKLYIYTGYNSTVSGQIDAGGYIVYLPKTELAITDGDIYVVLAYETPSYSVHVYQGAIEDSPWASNIRASHYLIASCNSGKITQLHKTGAIIVTGRWL
jgi:hypothetical protein